MTARKPRVGLDCDDVLADLGSLLFKVANAITEGTGVTPVRNKWDLELPQRHLDELWKLMGEPGSHKHIKPCEGALEGVKKLQEIADVYVVTHHLRSAKEWVHEREAWLLENFGINPEKVIHTSAKYTFFGSMLVDDKPSNVEAWAKEHPRGVPVLWTQPHNENHIFESHAGDWVRRTNDWGVVCELARGLAKRRVFV
jgi:5'(3')-deoxyribonucleotidase